MVNRHNPRADLYMRILKIAVVCTLTAAICLALYRFDNKYTAVSPQGNEGVLTLNQDSLATHPLVFLIDGWEYYGGQLLTPEDFAHTSPPRPNQYTYIGELGGFEKWNSGLPHGSASYRLTIQIPETIHTYELELPEIFSAYQLYVNGKQVAQMGDPNPTTYNPQTGNRTVSIEAGGVIELLFAVTDYSHLYSGIVYPPAFGEPQAVTNLLNARLVIRSILCATALTIGLLSVLIGLLGRGQRLPLLYGLLCLLFLGYVSYPITRTLGTTFQLPYIIENISFCGMLLVAMLIAMKISNFPRKWGRPFVIFGGLICLTSAAVFLLLPLGNLDMITGYSTLVSLYELVAAGFILSTVFYSTRKKQTNTTPILLGAVVLVCALILDRLLPLYEPIYTGWFIELASFILVTCIGIVIGQDVATQYKESIVLTEQTKAMEKLYQSQLSHYHALKHEVEQVKTIRHDIRHHIAVMTQYLQKSQYSKALEYLSHYQQTLPTGALPEYCPIDVINILMHHYHTVAAQHNIQLDFRCDVKGLLDPTHIGISDADLCCLYSNLMENAVESCLGVESEKRLIRINIFTTSSSQLNIRIRNTGDHVQMHNNRFFSTKSSRKGKETGYGLLSITAIAAKHHGTAQFQWNEEVKQFESKITLEV